MSSEHREKLGPQGETVIFLVYDKGSKRVWLEERIDPNSGYFGYTIIPGGKREEFDKTLGDALFRETFEELGIMVTHGVYLDGFIDMSLSGNLRMNHAFLVDEFKGEVNDSEKDKGKSRLISVELSGAEDYLELASSRYVIHLARRQLGL